MKCENVFCIYHAKGSCRWKQIAVDPLGMCSECIYPEPEAEALAREKEKALRRITEASATKTEALQKKKIVVQ